MKKLTTPAPRRAGTEKHNQAECYAHRVLEILDGDADSVRLFVEIAETIRKKGRRLRRHA